MGFFTSSRLCVDGIVGNQQLVSFGGGLFVDAVAQADLFKLKAGEDLPNGRHVVNRQQEAPFDVAQLLGQPFEVGFGEDTFAVHRLTVPIRRVDVEEGTGLVVAGDEVVVVELLQHYSLQSSVAVLQLLGQPVGAELGRAGAGGGAAELGHLAAEAHAVQIEEAHRTLDVGQGGGIAMLQPAILIAAGQQVFGLPQQLGQVVLNTPI